MKNCFEPPKCVNKIQKNHKLIQKEMKQYYLIYVYFKYMYVIDRLRIFTTIIYFLGFIRFIIHNN